MLTPRERRLLSEFEGMKALRSPHSLFDFRCADLSAAEATEYLRSTMSFDVVKNAWPGFLKPEEFEQEKPGRPPEKYLILFTCTGLDRQEDGTILEVSEHAMEVVFGWRYPAEHPEFIWLTPIWHPNFRPPYICIEGHPFAVGLTLDQIVPEVGRMIQYQNYNVKDPLNQEAAEWARQNAENFPVDDRDVLDKRRKVGAQQGPRLVEIIPAEAVRMRDPGQLVEIEFSDAQNTKMERFE